MSSCRLARLLLPGVLLALAVSARAGEVEKIRDTGPDWNRLVLVLVGDGYTQAQRDDFRGHAAQTVSVMLATSPYREYAELINVYTVFVASVESGADKPSPCYSPEVFRDTAFDGTYCTSSTRRLATVNNAAVFAEVNTSVPSWDLIGVIMNDPEYGGSGGSILTFSTDPSAMGELFLHEAGHTFARLADEYETPFDPVKRDPEPNVDLDAVFDLVKWNPWIEPGTPLPTPETVDVIGAYEGARYHAEGIFRPVRNCKMRTLNRPFGAVCKEGHVQMLYTFVSPVDGESPNAGLLEPSTCAVLDFEVFPQLPDPMTIEGVWELDGVEVATGFSYSLDVSTLPAGVDSILEVTLTDTTPLVRRTYRDPMQDRRTWTLHPVAGGPDLDGDGLPDACDDDIDGDGTSNPDDCAPWDPAVTGQAPEVPLLLVAKGPGQEARLQWEDVLGPSGIPEEGAYLVVRGELAALAADGGFDRACRLEGDRQPSFEDAALLPGGDAGRWYLVAGVNDCGPGSLGTSMPPGGRDAIDPTTLPACP